MSAGRQAAGMSTCSGSELSVQQHVVDKQVTGGLEGVSGAQMPLRTSAKHPFQRLLAIPNFGKAARQQSRAVRALGTT